MNFEKKNQYFKQQVCLNQRQRSSTLLFHPMRCGVSVFGDSEPPSLENTIWGDTLSQKYGQALKFSLLISIIYPLLLAMTCLCTLISPWTCNRVAELCSLLWFPVLGTCKVLKGSEWHHFSDRIILYDFYSVFLTSNGLGIGCSIFLHSVSF